MGGTSELLHGHCPLQSWKMLQTLRGPDRAVPEQTAWESPPSAAGLQEHQDLAQPQTVWLAGSWA